MGLSGQVKAQKEEGQVEVEKVRPGSGQIHLDSGSEREERNPLMGGAGTQAVHDQRSFENAIKECGSATNNIESTEQVGTHCAEPVDDKIGLGASHVDSARSTCPGGKLGSPESALRTTQRRRKFKASSGLEVSKSHPRRLGRLKNRQQLTARNSQSNQGVASVSLSDGDIENCNTRLRDPVLPAEPTKLWEVGKRVGLICQRVEKKVIDEYACMEERDLVVTKSVEEGKNDGL